MATTTSTPTPPPPPDSLYIRTFLLKIASRCNINCAYCYEFNLADSAWKRKPPRMSDEVIERALKRINEHIEAHRLKSVNITFHGGEPMLAGRESFTAVLQRSSEIIGDNCKVHFSLQTNGTLLDSEWLDFFLAHKISVGLSIDGHKAANDRFRIDHQGCSTFALTERGLSLLSRPEYKSIRGGLLSVMHPENDPIEVFDWLCAWNYPPIDFLFPLHNHVQKPPFRFDPESGYGFGKWLSRIFDKWYWEDMHQVKVRTFDDIMHLMLGGIHTTESFGLSPVRLAVIQSDGAYEAVDSLKSSYEGAVETGRTVFDTSIDDLFTAPLIGSRLNRANHLCDQCKQCSLVRVCGAGYIPHRYHATYGFLAPSVYCQDLIYLIRHIEGALRASGDKTVSSTIDTTLRALEPSGASFRTHSQECAENVGGSRPWAGLTRPNVHPR